MELWVPLKDPNTCFFGQGSASYLLFLYLLIGILYDASVLHICWFFFFNLLKGKRSTDLVFAIWLLCCRSYVLCVTQNKKWVSDWQTDGSDNNMKIYQWVLIFLEYPARFNNNAFIVGCAWGSTFAPNASTSMTMYASSNS